MNGFRPSALLHGGRSWSSFVVFHLSPLILLTIISSLVLFSSVNMVFGHAFVLDRIPAPSETLKSPPSRVEIFLSEPVDEKYSEVRVLGPDGKQIDNQDTQYVNGDQTTLGVTLPKEGLEDGAYTVSTKMLSQIDGHVTDDAFVFGVGEATSLPSAAESGEPEQDTTTASAFKELSMPDAIARYPSLVGQVVVVGAAFASLWLWKPFAKVKWLGESFGEDKQDYSGRRQKRTTSQATSDDFGYFRERIDRRLVRMMLIGASIVLLADFGIIYALAYSLNIGMVEAMATKFGNIWVMRTGLSFLLFSLVLFFYLKVGKRVRVSARNNPSERTSKNTLTIGGLFFERESLAVLIVGILTLLTTSLMGHGAAVTTGAQIPITIDFIHNLAASVWIGGVIYLALVVVPKLKKDKRMDEYFKFSILGILIPRFSTVPVVVLGIIVITGPFLLYILEDDLNLTLASLYGKALLAKLIIAAIMLVFGGYNQRVIHKDALDAIGATDWQRSERLVVSSSADNGRSRSSSSSSADSYSNDNEIVRSPNKLTLLLENVLRKITQRKGERNHDNENENIKASKWPIDLGENNGIYHKQVKALKASDHDGDDQSKKNPEMKWSRTISRFNRSIMIEAILGILLLGAVAVLTNTGLPASEFQGQLQQIAEDRQQTDIQNMLVTTSGTNNGIGDQGNVDGYSATQYLDNATARIKLTIDPFSVGRNNFEIQFLDLSGNPIDTRAVEMKLTQTEENIGPIEIQTNKISEGLFTANASFGLAGQWDLFVEGTKNDTNALNLVAQFNLFVKPDLDQIEYSVTQIAMPDNKSQPLYPIYDSSHNSIWVGDTSLRSGRIFEYDISKNEYLEHKINGTNIITTMALDQSSDQLWFIDPISKVLGLYDPQANSSKLYKFPNDRIVPSSIAVRSAEFPINDSRTSVTAARDIPSLNETANGNLFGNKGTEDRLGNNSPTVWITSTSTGEILIFDPQLENFTNSLPLPTPNSNPLGIVVDSSNGQIWIAEGIGKIAKIDPSTNFTINEYAPAGEKSDGGDSAGAGPVNDTLISPTGLLIDPYTGSIYISEHEGYVVSVFNPVFKTFSDFPPIAEDALPFGMTLDKDRNLWVAEHVTNRIAVIDPSTSKSKEVTIPSSSPFVQYLATDNDGKVWFAAQRGNAIGYIASSVNPLKGTSPGLASSSSSSSSGAVPGQGGNTSEATTSLERAEQTPFTLLSNIGYEYLISPLIAICVVACAALYVNSVVTLKTSIKQVNIFGTKKTKSE